MKYIFLFIPFVLLFSFHSLASGLKTFMVHMCFSLDWNNLYIVLRNRWYFSLYREVIEHGTNVHSDTTVFFRPSTHGKKEREIHVKYSPLMAQRLLIEPT